METDMKQDGNRTPEAACAPCAGSVSMERLCDLVRHQRTELHEAGLITATEYVEIAEWGSASARRLEGYDDLRARLEKAADDMATCRKAFRDLRAAVLRLVSLPNWRNRLSGWKDIDDAAGLLEAAVNSPNA